MHCALQRITMVGARATESPNLWLQQTQSRQHQRQWEGLTVGVLQPPSTALQTLVSQLGILKLKKDLLPGKLLSPVTSAEWQTDVHPLKKSCCPTRTLLLGAPKESNLKNNPAVSACASQRKQWKLGSLCSYLSPHLSDISVTFAAENILTGRCVYRLLDSRIL